MKRFGKYKYHPSKNKFTVKRSFKKYQRYR